MNSIDFELGTSTQTLGDGSTSSIVSERKVLDEMAKQGIALPAPTASGATPEGFGSFLEKSISGVNQSQVEADHAIRELVAGRSKNLHETLLAVERADTSLKLMMQVRNKILDAYREIIRMQV